MDLSALRARFWAHVIKGPHIEDCWIWSGAIADDGYGRFWTSTPTGQKVVRPQRWAYQEIIGTDLTPSTILRHRCDLPICVHVDTSENHSHLVIGDTIDNAADRSERRRVRNGHDTFTITGAARRDRALRMRELRERTLQYGYDREAVRSAIAGHGLEQLPLF